MSNTPQIRFAGFTDAWEQRELRTAATFSKGSGYSKNDLKENGTPIILYGRLYTKYETVISEVDTFVDVQPNSVYSTGHEVIVPASGETAEDISRASFVAKSGILLGGDLNIIVPDDYINPVFLALTISNGNQQKELSKRAQGKSVVHIHNSDLENVVLLYPKYEEQEKIGEYFSKLDSLITLHQREYFSFDFGSGSAKIAQNTLSWEQRKFSDFTFAAGERNKDDLDLEPFAITNNQGFIAQSEAHDDFGYMKDVDRKMYIVVKPNSFAYNPARINVGSLGYYEGAENVIVSSLYEVFQTAEYVDDKFLKHWFKTKAFQDWIERLQEGSVRLYFYYDKLCECIMSMPSVEEQRKIASA